MSSREVVVTGAGLTTPLGVGIEENWRGLTELKSGIGYYPKESLPPGFQYFGTVRSFEVGDSVPPSQASQLKFLNRGALLGFSSAREALKRSQADSAPVARGRRALYIASGDLTQIGCEFFHPAIREGTTAGSTEIDLEKLNRSTLTQVNPFFLLETISNNLFSFLSAFSDFMGPNTSLASLSPCGSQALELAYRSIREGRADVALAVGCGRWVTDIPLFELQGLGLLSSCDAGARSFRPFDRWRDGFIPGEGGAAVVLEAAEIAERRKANVLATLKGCGSAIEFSSSRGLAVPERICSRSLRLALEDAGCDIYDLAFISGHGSATQKGDRSELLSILEILDSERATVPVCGMKPYTGHMGAASDVAEVVFGIWAIRNRLVPATLNFTSTEKDLSAVRVFTEHHSCEKSLFLSISYGIGGQSSCLILSVP